MYKINLHAHTNFSDGRESPYRMAKAAKEAGFVSLVITDHFKPNRYSPCSLTSETYKLLKRQCRDASSELPIIVGIELALAGEEMLVFGSAMIKRIFRHADDKDILTIQHLIDWKKQYDSAFILCHPQDPDNWEALMPILDGYEMYNSRFNYFDNRPTGVLEWLPSWCNSDAHSEIFLDRCYNLVSSKITTETKLIKYIQRGHQPEFVISGLSDKPGDNGYYETSN